MDSCKNSNLYICSGRLGNDYLIGKCTSKDKSLIDYLLSTSEGIRLIKEFCVHDFCPLLSDIHCKLSLNIYVSIEVTNQVRINRKPRLWGKNKETEFRDNVDIDEVNKPISSVEISKNQSNITGHDLLSSIIEDLNNILVTSSKNFLVAKIHQIQILQRKRSLTNHGLAISQRVQTSW